MTPSAAIVLAAGLGRRMGGPKALLVVDGQPLIAAHVQRLRAVGCAPIIVVTRAALDLPGAQVVCAQTGSMAESLSAALSELAPRLDRVLLVAPVDTLPARIATLRVLLSAAESESVLVATPQHRGLSGHPIAMRESLLRVFTEGYTGTLRDLVRSVGAQRRKVEVDDAATLIDLDTPADLARLRPGLEPRFASRNLCL